jgi:hypothetical protein
MGGAAPGDGREDDGCRSARHDVELYPPPVSGGRTICTGCRDQVEEDLVELPVLYELCAHMLDLRRHQLRERVSGHRPSGIALNEAVVTVRTTILGVLASWCGLVSAERGVTGPDELSIRRLTTFLSIHLTWLTEHTSAPDLVDELMAITASAHEVLRPRSGGAVTLGPCARPGCAELVRAEGYVEGGSPYRVTCAAGHVWAPDQWLLMWGGPNRTKRNPSPEGAE